MHRWNCWPSVLHTIGTTQESLFTLKALAMQGSRIFADRIAHEDDPQIQNLEANGAIVVGKSNMPEFGAGANTYNE